MLDLIQPFLLSFAIGLLIGIERERSQIKNSKAIGMRTFVLFALLGTLAAKIQHSLLTLSLSLFVFGALLLNYTLTRVGKPDKKTAIGLTTEMAGAAVFLLGYLVFSQRLLAVMLGTVVLIMLYGRHSLHEFAKKKITTQEIEAAITIIVLSLGIISFLPDRTIDPWQLFNPRSFGFIILILSGLQFSGYIVIRLFGERLGMLLIGFFGGLVSSTAVFASLSHAKRNNKRFTASAVMAGIFATIATLIAFLIVIVMVSPPLLTWIVWPVLTTMLIGGVSSWLFIHHQQQEKIEITYPNPLDIKSIIKLASVIMISLLLAAITKQYLGLKMLPMTTFLTSLFELQGMTYAIALLFQDHLLSLGKATQLLGIAVIASFISKFMLVWIIARNRFAAIISLYLTAMLAAGILVYSILVTHEFSGVWSLFS